MDEFFELEKIAMEHALKLSTAPDDKKMETAENMMSALSEKLEEISKQHKAA